MPGLHCRAPCADSIINPEAPLALRLSGQLLLGVVKVYSKKVGYLHQDCNDALAKIKEARAPPHARSPSDLRTPPRAPVRPLSQPSVAS